MNEEVVMVKNKYKKMRRIILIILLVIILIYAGNILITALRIQRVFIDNTNVDLGDNYKLTRVHNDLQTITYYKDGITNVLYTNGKNSLYVKDNQYYYISYDKKEYVQRNDIKEFVEPSSTVSLLNYWGTFEDGYVHSLKNMIELTFQANAKFSTENINGQKYEVIEMKGMGDTLWINKDNHFIEKEDMQGQIVEQKIEKNVVTDEDVKAPWDMGFELKTIEQ